MKRHPRRSNEEWLNLIHECRTSGLPDRTWCEENAIQPSNFYYHIRRLRDLACEIPERACTDISTPTQTVVPISFSDSRAFDSLTKIEELSCVSPREVISIQINGIRLGITNGAAKETIAATLSVLQELC